MAAYTVMEDWRLDSDSRLSSRESRRDVDFDVENAAIQVAHGFAKQSKLPDEWVVGVGQVDLQARAAVLTFVPLVLQLLELERELGSDLAGLGNLLYALLFPNALLLV